MKQEALSLFHLYQSCFQSIAWFGLQIWAACNETKYRGEGGWTSQAVASVSRVSRGRFSVWIGIGSSSNSSCITLQSDQVSQFCIWQGGLGSANRQSRPRPSLARGTSSEASGGGRRQSSSQSRLPVLQQQGMKAKGQRSSSSGRWKNFIIFLLPLPLSICIRPMSTWAR